MRPSLDGGYETESAPRPWHLSFLFAAIRVSLQIARRGLRPLLSNFAEAFRSDLTFGRVED